MTPSPSPCTDQHQLDAAASSADWASAICAEIRAAVGTATVVLGGSRAVGNCSESADCDVSVLLPTWRIPRAAPRLSEAAERASRRTGLTISVNPMPRWRFVRPGENLYAAKLRSEGVVLELGPGVASSLGPVDWRRATHGAITSYLMSAVHVLLLGVEPADLAAGEATLARARAVRKAVLQAAQARLLASGSYVSEYAPALDRLGDEELRGCGDRADEAQSFLSIRRRILGMLGPEPVRRTWPRALAHDVEFVLLSALRHRNRGAIAWRNRGVEGALARASVLLLAALDPKERSGLDESVFRRAVQTLPSGLRPSQADWGSVRSVVVAEWANAHPLVGMLR